MKEPVRKGVFLLSWISLLPALTVLIQAMPEFGNHGLPYGDFVNRVGPATRHVTNMVSAVNFDIRGIDTLGEESMLVAAVTGTMVLLRGNRGEQLGARPGKVEGREVPERSEALLLLARPIALITLLFGMYVVLHAMTTPGGGFQGGVIIASGALLLFLGEGYRGWRDMMKTKLFDAIEGFGLALYAAAGFAPMFFGLPYLTNILPCGKLGDVFSGGLMLVVNLGVGMAVTGGFISLFIEFLEETRMIKTDDA